MEKLRQRKRTSSPPRPGASAEGTVARPRQAFPHNFPSAGGSCCHSGPGSLWGALPWEVASLPPSFEFSLTDIRAVQGLGSLPGGGSPRAFQPFLSGDSSRWDGESSFLLICPRRPSVSWGSPPHPPPCPGAPSVQGCLRQVSHDKTEMLKCTCCVGEPETFAGISSSIRRLPTWKAASSSKAKKI